MFRYLQLLQQYLIYIVWQWQRQAQHIMDIISFHMNSFMLEMFMVKRKAKHYLNILINDVLHMFTVRNGLIMCALFSLLTGLSVLVTSVMLVVALRKEYEHKIVPWLWTFAIFTIIRFFSFLFFSIVNDLIFAYNILMVLIWIVLIFGCAYSWMVIYSLYLELADLTKLEDLAHLRVSFDFVFFFLYFYFFM